MQDDDDDGYPCPVCGTPWHIVRPGKQQPSCCCYSTCAIHKTFYEFIDEPNHHRYGCRLCGPGGRSVADVPEPK